MVYNQVMVSLAHQSRLVNNAVDNALISLLGATSLLGALIAFRLTLFSLLMLVIEPTVSIK